MPDVQDPPRRIKPASWWLHVATALLVGELLVNWGELAFLLFILDLKITGFALSVVAGAISFVLGSSLLFPFVNNVVCAHEGIRAPSPVADRLGAGLSFSLKLIHNSPFPIHN